jgi:hypothetical protein
MNNGTGMDTPPNSEPSGAVTSRQATRKHPRQQSGFKVDKNKHGIRRETSLNPPQKKTRPKKV